MSDPTVEAAPTAGPLPRSPELFTADASLLLVVDMQPRLLAVQPRGGEITWNCRRLLDAAAALGVRVGATEQSPAKLGATVDELRQRLAAPPHAKAAFTAACNEVAGGLFDVGVDRIVVCGIESHVCIQQTALDLLSAAYRVAVPVDAISSRHQLDHDTALRRMESSGAVLTTTEALMFEWCQTAAHPAFRKISALAKEYGPGTGD